MARDDEGEGPRQFAREDRDDRGSYGPDRGYDREAGFRGGYAMRGAPDRFADRDDEDDAGPRYARFSRENFGRGERMSREPAMNRNDGFRGDRGYADENDDRAEPARFSRPEREPRSADQASRTERASHEESASHARPARPASYDEPSKDDKAQTESAPQAHHGEHAFDAGSAHAGAAHEGGHEARHAGSGHFRHHHADSSDHSPERKAPATDRNSENEDAPE
jgi:hypothetical protein